MSRIRLACLVVLTSVAVYADSAIRHVSVSDEDRFVSCISEVLGKPVMPRWMGRTRLEVRCPAGRQELIDALRLVNTAVVDAGDWMVLTPLRYYTTGTKFDVPQWKRLQILTRPHIWNVPTSRPLTPREQSELASQVLHSIRGVPIDISASLEQGIPGELPPRPDDETSVREVFVTLDAHRLSSSAQETIVAVVTGGYFGAESRLAVGEVRDGRLVLLWDSPLFWGWRLALGYNDVDGDGVEDILLDSNYGNARNPVHMLTIVTRDGVELTRQKDCELESALWDEAGSFCPIVADSMTLVAGDRGTKNIRVEGSLKDSKSYLYRLVNERFVRRNRTAR